MRLDFGLSLTRGGTWGELAWEFQNVLAMNSLSSHSWVSKSAELLFLGLAIRRVLHRNIGRLRLRLFLSAIAVHFGGIYIRLELFAGRE